MILILYLLKETQIHNGADLLRGGGVFPWRVCSDGRVTAKSKMKYNNRELEVLVVGKKEKDMKLDGVSSIPQSSLR